MKFWTAFRAPFVTAWHNAHEAFLYNYPLNRRKVAWRRAQATFEQAFSKYAWALAASLGMLNIASGANVVDVGKIAEQLITLDWQVIGAGLGGAILSGLLAGASSFRKWAKRPDPTETGSGRRTTSGGPN